MAERRSISLKLRLIIGAAVIALVAISAAALAAWGTATTAQLTDRASAAQVRIDLLSGLSARVSDYAVVAVETTKPSVPQGARQARLSSQKDRVDAAFSSIDATLAKAVQDAESEGEEYQMRTATRSLVVARMRAQFEALVRSINPIKETPQLRAHLDGFATQFSPLVNEAIAEEQTARNEYRAAVGDLQSRLITMAVVLAFVALALLALFYIFLVRPLIGQLTHIRTAAAGIGNGNFDIQLPSASSPELNHVFGALSSTARRLKDRQADVDQDRAALNQIIADRTSELETANQRLSQIDQDRRRFFADVGHELRTPLTVILAESELGMQGPLDPKDAAESLSVINARAKRLNRRIDDLLRVARSESGEIQFNSQSIDLAECAKAAIDDIAPLAKRRSMSLAADLSPTPAVGDEDWCRQIIGGLIENALRHAKDGSAVQIKTSLKSDSASVAVSDDGPGLPADQMDAVFNRFTQGNSQGAGLGFGVGLALARWVIEGQSGTIELYSPALAVPEGATARGPGVTVKITLPGGQ